MAMFVLVLLWSLTRAQRVLPLAPPAPTAGGIHAAVLAGDMSLLDHCLSQDASHLELPDALGWTPLTWAAVTGQHAVLAHLIDLGADLNPRDSQHRTPLLIALWQGHEQVALALIQAGADVLATDMLGNVPLVLAQDAGLTRVMRRLLEAGAYKHAKRLGPRKPSQRRPEDYPEPKPEEPGAAPPGDSAPTDPCVPWHPPCAHVYVKFDDGKEQVLTSGAPVRT